MEPPGSGRVSVINQSGRRLQKAPVQLAAEFAVDLSEDRRPEQRPASQTVCILLTTDREVRELNLKFRGLDESTDVLSFPGPDLIGAPLGDIAISVPFAERQAVARGVSLRTELQYLAIHGVLHLLGWDDESDEGRDQMQAEMARVARAGGLPDDRNWHSLHEAALGGDR